MCSAREIEITEAKMDAARPALNASSDLSEVKMRSDWLCQCAVERLTSDATDRAKAPGFFFVRGAFYRPQILHSGNGFIL